jgi:RNA polymerase sigma factor (sigma-70 family)
MSEASGETARLLDRFNPDDKESLNALLTHASKRLRSRASRMLKGFSGVERWEQTDDVLQEALVRLWRALVATKLKSVRHFHRWASRVIRHLLIDMARHYMGPHGVGANHHTGGARKAADDPGAPLDLHCGHHEPDSLEAWTAFHRYIDSLPDKERELFDLLWYQGLTHKEAAKVLGISENILKKRWQLARQKLAAKLGNDWPT